ncbi:MAG: bifunctional 4-hydroxy-2-oxoglutarate aldolase/2-dehydro-3-deoxy-phosphogluconate aldolase [Verrucomicrobia bacterium]|jgi:2-dehydro-3-deoxyphosphogluconate aldolase/(4S)-4-hydroxy-2-oxoglutarate aldolase|nr:bifunctional 4-hydroxy-2-oxoglutarate aldolase/2-dehydro-3-deoxy-phosphogluconate aldolase [Verrucomicrobiota bacterium]
MSAQLSRDAIIQRLLDPGVIAVVRARAARQVPALAEALVAGGVIAVEVTMTTPDALEAIRATAAALGPRGLVGVGTVLDAATATAAIGAGAEFVVSPICRTELIGVAHRAGKPVMIGAYTPTEAQLAHEAGADFVKLFPADGLGAGYVKALRAPLPHLRLVPTGGVDLNTIPALIQAGCVAVGAGSSLVSASILAAEDWPQLTRLAAQFVEAIRTARAAKS